MRSALNEQKHPTYVGDYTLIWHINGRQMY